MTKHRFLFPLLLSSLLLFGCSSNNVSTPLTPKAPELQKFILAKNPAKLTYKAGEYFSPSGMVALAQYDDGSEKAVYGYDIDPAAPLTFADDEVTISFRGKSFAVPIHVEGGEEKSGMAISYPMGNWNEDYVEEVVPSSDGAYLLPSQVEVPLGDCHTPEQYAYLSSDYNAVSRFANGNKELSHPLPYVLELDEDASWYVQISESKDFATYQEFQVEGDHYDFYNGKINLNYYWRASTTKEGLTSAPIDRFLLLPSGPRNLFVEGVAHVRDIGGYPSKLGGVIRQGLYYRGGRLNASSSAIYKQEITEEGLRVLTEDLGVMTDIDLRMNDLFDPTAPISGWAKNE
ncbi:MAG: tyrosine-protein phosphatase [Bacilli bacterium]|nr:tyrosine-protein phosphatase [Bacilli bacterium]